MSPDSIVIRPRGRVDVVSRRWIERVPAGDGNRRSGKFLFLRVCSFAESSRVRRGVDGVVRGGGGGGGRAYSGRFGRGGSFAVWICASRELWCCRTRRCACGGLGRSHETHSRRPSSFRNRTRTSSRRGADDVRVSACRRSRRAVRAVRARSSGFASDRGGSARRGGRVRGPSIVRPRPCCCVVGVVSRRWGQTSWRSSRGWRGSIQGWTRWLHVSKRASRARVVYAGKHLCGDRERDRRVQSLSRIALGLETRARPTPRRASRCDGLPESELDGTVGSHPTNSSN